MLVKKKPSPGFLQKEAIRKATIAYYLFLEPTKILKKCISFWVHLNSSLGWLAGSGGWGGEVGGEKYVGGHDYEKATCNV